MTPKELLYVEDALGHDKQMKDICRSYAPQIQDAELKGFVENLSIRYGQSFNKLYGLLTNA